MRRVRPMLADTTPEPFDSAWHVFEPKYNGVRCLARLGGQGVDLYGRHDRTYAARLPELGQVPRQVRGARALLDGELVVLDKGLTDFAALQARLFELPPEEARRAAESTPVSYIVFDLLNLEGRDLTAAGEGLPLRERRTLLERTLDDSERCLLMEQVPQRGIAFFEDAISQGHEGVLAKRQDGLYYPGHRRTEWLKICGIMEDSFVIGGLSQGGGKRVRSFGALLLGRLTATGELDYFGSVGSGFTERDLREIKTQAAQLSVEHSPFGEHIRDARAVTFLRPTLVADVKYYDITPEKRLRHPVFLRLRYDLLPEDCRV